MWRKLLNALPRAYNMAEEDWQRRHRLMLWVLGVHVPALATLGLLLGYAPRTVLIIAIAPLIAVAAGYLLRGHRRLAATAVTAGFVYCSVAFVGLSHGAIEAHFHFFITIGFIALYQDWAPLLFDIVCIVISHGVGSMWQQNLIFAHVAGQTNPWLWSVIHGAAALLAWTGMIVFWRFIEDAQREKDTLARRLADSEINRRQFTSDLLTNLARRNQSLLHRQLEIINQMEESERDPDALSDLFALDHIATRVRRNAESLLVLSGEQPPRTWSEPVPLRDVLRAAIAETENLERVVFVVDEQSAVVGHTVTDVTHLLAELTENAVRFSPPDATVTVRSRPDRGRPGGRMITIEDWGVGMPAEQIEEANRLLAAPPDIDLSVSQRLGFHVVARLAARHGIKVALSVTPGSGTTALVALPPSLFAPLHPSVAMASAGSVAAGATAAPASLPRASVDTRAATPKRSAAQASARAEHRPPPEASRHGAERADWSGWWDPAVVAAMPPFDPTSAGSGTSPAAAGLAPLSTGPTDVAHEQAIHGAGPTVIAHDTSVFGFGPARPATDSSLSGASLFDPAAHRPTVDSASPISSAPGSVSATGGSGPVTNGAGPTANTDGAAGNGSGPASNGFGPTTAGPGRTAPAFGGTDHAEGPIGNAGLATSTFGAIVDGFAAVGDGVGRRGDGADADAPAGPSRATADHGDDNTPRDAMIVNLGFGAPASPPLAGDAAHPKPSPSPRPVIIDTPAIPAGAVPTPRNSSPVDPVSGLRRRIPQAHLSAELRTPETQAEQPVFSRRSTADAAAALSRYQASRAAAQAAVGDPTASDTARGSATITDRANGGRA